MSGSCGGYVALTPAGHFDMQPAIVQAAFCTNAPETTAEFFMFEKSMSCGDEH